MYPTLKLVEFRFDIWESVLYNGDPSIVCVCVVAWAQELEKSGNGLLIISKFDFSRRPSVGREQIILECCTKNPLYKIWKCLRKQLHIFTPGL